MGDKTMMIDVQAREITEKDLAAALILAHPEPRDMGKLSSTHVVHSPSRFRDRDV
ncbi:hypothetical protein Bca52824_056496 [Brassica carinata]|uniref:Uncharacterized protein n=1 Tax=Brassica carinata TaxID=52824 RepID=A0A8X7QPK3_BRACI|nr:hypothetical protein Bca52824_056496 [Brassica carinata]